MHHLLDKLRRRLGMWNLVGNNAAGGTLDADLLSQLREQRQGLLDVSHEIEAEFCSLGTQMQTMAAKAAEISSLSSHIQDVTLGKQEDGGLQCASRLFTQAIALIEASDEEYACDLNYLVSFSEGVEVLRRGQPLLQQILLTLSSIIITFRVEAEHLPPEGRSSILSLAAEIDSLCKRMRQTLDERTESLATARAHLQETVHELIERVARHRQEIDQRKIVIQTHLANLESMSRRSGALGTSVATAAKHITDHIGQIVVAIQYHDISRQKLDHVAEVVEEFCGLAEAAAKRGHDAAEERELLGYLHEVMVIQVRQLGAASKELSDAGRSLIANMRGVIDCTQTLASDASSTANDTGADRGNDIIDAFLGEIKAIIQFVACGTEINATLANTIRPIGEMVSSYTEMIRSFSIQIRTAGLNAQVQAAHWLQAGALDLLALRTRTSADQTISVIDNVSSQLKELLANVHTLDQRLAAFLENGQNEQLTLQQKASAATSKLHAMRQEINSGIAEIGQLQAKLSAEVEPVLSSIHFPERVATCAAQVIAAFSLIIDRTVVDRGGENEAIRARVEQLTRRYTMERERDVHGVAAQSPQEITEQKACVSAEQSAIPSTPGGSSPANTGVEAAVTPEVATLGDNVELF